ncbi:FliI/YscN family ATPase [Dyella ginsengisoli]|uniref:FliI/YscN family ATPase n=1 Tax=Dyella ginsengisoli TaxID=363848 RepID=UPI000365E978|nr:FliI/YscN family ATPase [Dyella ginsengisoli]
MPTALQIARSVPLISRSGQVLSCNGLAIEARGPHCSLGELCSVETADGVLHASVVGLREDRIILMPYGTPHGVMCGMPVRALDRSSDLAMGPGLLGRVIDALGNPIDDQGAIPWEERRSLYSDGTAPLEREPVRDVLETGVRSIDALLTIGKGQRVGIFAGSGVGKSTLLGMLTSDAKVDVVVVALVGERGREVGDFIRHALGEEGRKRAVVVAATADQPALLRAQSVHAAHAIAEYFREQGKDVLLVVDSITRFAMAQREIGTAAGEPPAARGYPPSVFGWLPRIVERCGKWRDGGSITAVYTVLVEGDDMNEPIADHMRAILDGHIVLNRELADRGQLPAVDVLRSISRLMPQLASRDELALARGVRASLAIYERSRDLISMGAYQRGHDTALDAAVDCQPRLEAGLAQSPEETSTRQGAMDVFATALNSEREAET